MPQMSSKTLQAKTAHSHRSRSAGSNGAALSPPAYGIDFIDRPVERENKTGLPDTLKAGIENLSGLAMDDVRVHYNSSKPAALQALAYTQGTEIHVGPGQKRHLPHEAWHVMQQKEERVRPTLQVKGVAINNDEGLEKEADVMGVNASKMAGTGRAVTGTDHRGATSLHCKIDSLSVLGSVNVFAPVDGAVRSAVIQRSVDESTLDFKSDKGKSTILGILKDKNLTKVYKLPEDFDKTPRKGTTELDRAREAEAEIGPKNSTKRGNQSSEYKDISALGRWERQATTHTLTQKTLDVGHLIADEFFDNNQKEQAYVPKNLATQDAEFNEEAYRRIVEEPIAQDLASGQNVKLKVTLEYTDDPLDFPVETLVERKALDVLKPAEHNNLMVKKTRLSVPRRMPTSWKSKIEPMTVPANLSIAPNPTTFDFVSYDPSRTQFTPSVRFTVRELQNTALIREHEFQQGNPFEDPQGIRNPAKMGVHPEGGRYTKRQLTRGKRTISGSSKFKVIESATDVAADLIKSAPAQKRSKTFSELTTEVVEVVKKANSGTKKADVLREVEVTFEDFVFNAQERKRVRERMQEEVLSEDEDLATAQI
jgi:hypothetical protein